MENPHIQGLEAYTEEEILSDIRSVVEQELEDACLQDIRIKGMAVYGSRKRGDASADSDLDVLLEYEGNYSEDGLFNLLNEEPLEYEGIRVDINPITRFKSGTLEQYMLFQKELNLLSISKYVK